MFIEGVPDWLVVGGLWVGLLLFGWSLKYGRRY